DGSPLVVVDVRAHEGRSRIPRTGAVLSFGGTNLPPELAALVAGTRVRVVTTWTTKFGLAPAALDSAESIVAGAGLLRAHGHAVTDWASVEHLNDVAFISARHPRTIVGLDGHGAIWLAAIDGRQPARSIGMSFADLERLCDRLGLTDALNL